MSPGGLVDDASTGIGDLGCIGGGTADVSNADDVEDSEDEDDEDDGDHGGCCSWDAVTMVVCCAGERFRSREDVEALIFLR